MQLGRGLGRGRSWPRWRRRTWLPYLKLALTLTFAAAVMFSGRHISGRWRPSEAGEPFPAAVSGPGEPIDGDSLWVGDSEVRLMGIDAPEWQQQCERADGPWRCGREARDELVRAIGADNVTCTISERDVYGRMLGHCRAGGRDLNAQMATSGMAIANGSYWIEEAEARSARRGLWAGEFDEPREWRARHERNGR